MFEAHNKLKLENSLRYCELTTQSKIPANTNWQNEDKLFDEVVSLFETQKSNIGLLLGNKSNIIDIDCDCPEAVIIGERLIEGHFASFFRNSKSGHFLFRCEGGKTIRLNDNEGSVLVELRADGAQTMVPPSVHPEGQPLSFTHWNENAREHQYDEVSELTHRIGALSLCFRCWNKGMRHQLSLCLAGLFQTIGLSYNDAFGIIQLLCDITFDEEQQRRLNNVKHTYQRPSHSNIGYEGIVQLKGREFANKVSNWLKIGFGIDVGKPKVPSNDNALTRLETITHAEEVTEARLAELYSAQLQSKALYCFSNKHWYLWDGNRWLKDEQRKICLLTRDFVRLVTQAALNGHGRDVIARILSFETANKMENLEKLAKSELAIHLTEFDANIMQLCVENGVIDLKTGRLLQPLPSMLHSKMAGVVYEEGATCLRFLQFLKDIFEDNDDLIEYFQRVVGYILTGSTEEQSIFMLLGGGANGKSTLVNILTKLLGDYVVNTPTQTLMASLINGVGDDLVRMAWARLSSTEQRMAASEDTLA